MNDKFSMGPLPSFQEIEQGFRFSQNEGNETLSPVTDVSKETGDLASYQALGEMSSEHSRKPVSSPLNPERFMVDEDLIDKDYSYMKKVCPSFVSQVSDWIEDECDRLEYEGSFLYDQYPDKITILKMTDRIVGKLPAGMTVTPKDLIQALLCDEIFYRRCRYYRKKKQFMQ